MVSFSSQTATATNSAPGSAWSHSDTSLRVEHLRRQPHDALLEVVAPVARKRSSVVEHFPAYAEQAIRVEFWGDEVERISKINPLTGDTIAQLDQFAIYPAKHFVTERPRSSARCGRSAPSWRSASPS